MRDPVGGRSRSPSLSRACPAGHQRRARAGEREQIRATNARSAGTTDGCVSPRLTDNRHYHESEEKTRASTAAQLTSSQHIYRPEKICDYTSTYVARAHSIHGFHIETAGGRRPLNTQARIDTFVRSIDRQFGFTGERKAVEAELLSCANAESPIECASELIVMDHRRRSGPGPWRPWIGSTQVVTPALQNRGDRSGV